MKKHSRYESFLSMVLTIIMTFSQPGVMRLAAEEAAPEAPPAATAELYEEVTYDDSAPAEVASVEYDLSTPEGTPEEEGAGFETVEDLVVPEEENVLDYEDDLYIPEETGFEEITEQEGEALNDSEYPDYAGSYGEELIDNSESDALYEEELSEEEIYEEIYEDEAVLEEDTQNDLVIFFESEHAKIYVDGIDVTASYVKYNENGIDFTVVADDGYKVESVSAAAGNLTTVDEAAVLYHIVGLEESTTVNVSTVETAETASEMPQITFSAVDENGAVINEEYENITIENFEGTWDFENTPLETDVTRVVNVEGTNRQYLETYKYQKEALIGNERILYIHSASPIDSESVTDTEGQTACSCVLENGTELEIIEDTEIKLVYSLEYKKTRYVYDDDPSIYVEAIVDDPAAIPDDAEFVVTRVLPMDANYSAYIDALNSHAEETAAQKNENLFSAYDEKNTLLFDVAFLADKVDENGVLIENEKVEIQPAEGSVRIRFSFKEGQLVNELGAEKKEDISVIHLPLNEDVAGTVDKAIDATQIEEKDITAEPIVTDVYSGNLDRVSFTLDSFSIVSISNNPDIYGETDQSNSQVNFNLALGRAVEYGIVADTYDQKNHQQTNFAVKEYMNSGSINGEPDLAGTHDVPYQIGSITKNKLRFGTSTYQSQAVQYDVYLPHSYENNINDYVQIDGGGKNEVKLIYESEDTIKNNVDSMITGAQAKADLMASHQTTITLNNNVITDENQLVIDTTNYPENAVIYLNVPDDPDYSKLRNVIGMQGSFHLHKHPNQIVVVNILGTSPISINKMIVTEPGEPIDTKDDRYSTFSPSGQNDAQNDRVDEKVAQKVIWNIPDSTDVTLNTAAGVFLVPKGNVNVTGTSAGWIVSGGKVTTDGCEFHYVYRDRHYTPQTGPGISRNIRFTNYKGIKDAAGKEIDLNGRQFDFSLYETDSSFSTDGEAAIETVKNSDLATVYFTALEINEADIATHTNGDFYYVIKEEGAGTTTDGVTNWDGQINIKLHAEVVGENIVFILQYYRYLSAEDMANGTTDNNVRDIEVAGEEFTLGRIFNNYDAETEININAVKKLTGGDLIGNDYSFRLTEVADAEGTEIVPGENETVYSDTKTNDANGIVAFNTITYSYFAT